MWGIVICCARVFKNKNVGLQLPYGLKYIVPPETHGTSLQAVQGGMFGMLLDGNKDVFAVVKFVRVCLGGGLVSGTKLGKFFLPLQNLPTPTKTTAGLPQTTAPLQVPRKSIHAKMEDSESHTTVHSAVTRPPSCLHHTFTPAQEWDVNMRPSLKEPLISHRETKQSQ